MVFVVTKDGVLEAKQTLSNGVLSADPSLPDLSTPLYVFVNANTASAAEVFAAALQVCSLNKSQFIQLRKKAQY